MFSEWNKQKLEAIPKQREIVKCVCVGGGGGVQGNWMKGDHVCGKLLKAVISFWREDYSETSSLPPANLRLWFEKNIYIFCTCYKLQMVFTQLVASTSFLSDGVWEKLIALYLHYYTCNTWLRGILWSNA